MTVTFDNAAAMPADETPSGARTEPAIQVRAEPAIHVRITLEVLIYAALAIFALLTHVIMLDHAPLADSEAHQALAVLRAINPQVAGEPLVADSTLTYVAQAISFTFLPQNDLAARLPVALAGVLLALSPALWRRYLNPLPPLIASLLLTISPVALLAARTSSPVIWTMLLAVTGPWLVLRFVETEQPRWAVLATVVFAAMVFLAGPAGFLTLFALAFGVIFAWLTDVDPETDSLAALRSTWQAWPWAHGVAAAGLVVLVAGTGLFWLPSGLTVVGGALWAGLEGFVRRAPDTPVGFPLWVSVRYETGLVLFGAMAAYRAIREGGFFERALAGWALAGLVCALAYAGAGAAHALWLTLPLSVLVALMVTGWITERASVIWDVPTWSLPVHAVVTLALWLAVGLSLVLLGKRLMLDLPPGVTDLRELADVLVSGVYSRNVNQSQAITVQGIGVLDYVLGFIQLRILITILVSLLNGVLFFLVGSLWGARASWRGYALGTLGFLLLFSFSLGGRAAFGTPGDPREYWNRHTPTADVFELRVTLRDMSLRDTGEPRLIAVTAFVPQDGALAWALRDYPNTVFVDGVGPEVSSAAVVMPVVFPQPPMGADYVGKDLITRQTWSPDSLSWRDGLTWWYRSDARVPPVTAEHIMIWIRKDVYGVEQVTED